MRTGSGGERTTTRRKRAETVGVRRLVGLTSGAAPTFEADSFTGTLTDEVMANPSLTDWPRPNLHKVVLDFREVSR